ncbi:MAG: circadian clock KaiB family protein [Ferruginibacter sp.]
MLKLYVCGMSGRSMEAIDNIKKYCAQHLDGDYNLEIIDIYKNPEIASEQQLIFSPSLIKLYPLPQKILVGNFSDSAKVSRGLGIANKV